MTTSYLEVDGGRIAYEAAGPQDGPLVVCLHGMGDNRSTFRLLAPRLAAAGHRVVSLDARGYGESSVGWQTYAHQAIGRDLLALVESCGRPAVIVGHSIGCAAAVWAAAQEPSKVEGLVLIGTFSGDTPAAKGLMRAAARVVGSSPALWGMFYGTLFKAGRPDDFAVRRKALVANLREPGRKAALRAQIEESLSGVRSRYGEVACPVLVVTGGRDPDMPDPEAEARAVLGKLRHATMVMVEGAGHYPHLEKPEQTAGLVIDRLAGLSEDPVRQAR
jgi:pimeloyl-ACP methyl ester carboxylesterase